ncbi:coniferyl aldehyde dehydrogenase [Pararobbsia silviterrae]|uniref:Aldehyde dehydrogenase n=1 Tax=Pararobbsia silviterrae TaxID=1792498 RepID=A0A494Y762_9BURK|nr:coniferyl aldehyde dehydrogenase [Pararobbsia silviterrae]RKP58561.1 coniferyl aldehyde dehydrogenase [Pararobbsia silviterrae]
MKNDFDPTLDLERLLNAQRLAFNEDPMPNWAQRAAHLRALDAMMLAHRKAIAGAIHEDFGNRAENETDIADVLGSHLGIKHALRHGRRWMRARRRSPGMLLAPASAKLVPQPLGVVGIIVPWNYPLFLAVGPLTGALAAGNRAMIKLSEFTPRFGELFARIIAQTFAPDHVTVVNGEADVARAFASLPFDRLVFTGSTGVGRHVMRAAAEHLTPVTLELGGKSPALIGPGARFAEAVDAVISSKLFNAGQTCVAPDYVLVPRGRAQAFIERARALTAKLYPDFANNTDYTSIISVRHVERLDALTQEAAARGATLHALADLRQAASGAMPAAARERDAVRRVVPQIITDAPDDTAIMREEIFGPLLPLVEYDRFDDALAYINARPRPLAMYLFETNNAVVDRALARTHSGGVTINDTLLHVACDDLPFGGIGPSGMGAYHGVEGFRTFSHMKPVLTQARFNLRAIVRPPYGKRVSAVVRMFLR